ncbi:MAG: DUF1569 domain-containing protein [Acidobacteriota bacterium]|nr:DUF1569 domain-containing protein [Acidobacteriota bacterium]
MKTLAKEMDKREILERLGRVNATSQRQWGSMTVGEMVCHVNDAFKIVMGEKEARAESTLFGRTVMKWAALKLPTQWPHGVKTIPECEAGKGGTPPAELARDIDELRGLVERFTAQPRAFTYSAHAIFGPMTDAEWQRWGYLHVDHHLRQFGA